MGLGPCGTILKVSFDRPKHCPDRQALMPLVSAVPIANLVLVVLVLLPEAGYPKELEQLPALKHVYLTQASSRVSGTAVCSLGLMTIRTDRRSASCNLSNRYLLGSLHILQIDA